MVDVTHDGDHRRTGDEVGLDAFVGTEGQIERVEQFAVLSSGLTTCTV